MSYFETILEKRGYDKCPLPLWKLKISDEEFEELRSVLEKRTHIINVEDPFNLYKKDATLFYAEYWRRIYKDGPHSKKKVYDALNSTCRQRNNYYREFYEAAVKGARSLGIEQYDGAVSQILDDMLYQGGLPMNLVTGNITNSIWDRFTRGLVNKKINFEELNLGLVASQSKGLREFCEQLNRAVEAGQNKLLPFYCEENSKSWNWFVYLRNLSKQERAKSRQLNPFTLDWEFKFDLVEKKFNISYIMKGVQQLPTLFITEQDLSTDDFISIHINENGKTLDTFDYVNSFCRYEVESKHLYRSGSEIALYLQDREEPHLSGYLDMEIPRLVYLNVDGCYKLGNRLGSVESLLLLPDGWILKDESSLTSDNFIWEDSKYSVFTIPAIYTQDLVVKGPDDKIVFSMNTPLYWTEMRTHSLRLPIINETLYNAEECKYLLCSRNENDDIVKIPARNVLFRNSWKNEWSHKASYGKISARIEDNTGNFVAPMRFINVGSGITVHLVKADSESCQIRAIWEHGHISTNEGVRKANDIWEIKKSDCLDPKKIHFLVTPNENGNNSFQISVKAPFKDFSIKDIYDEELTNNSLLPYTDLDKYQYHLTGQGIKEYRYGDVVRKLKWYDQKLYIIENDRKIRQIPYEGNLVMLFDSREAIRSLLEKTSLNMLQASINVVFITDNDEIFTFEIKESPFRAMQLDEGKIIITANYKPINSFRGNLKLLKLDEPTQEPIELHYDSENGYVLPEEIKPWGKTLLISEAKGRLCPCLVDLSTTLDKEARKLNRETVIHTITEGLKSATMNDELWKRIVDWFYIIEKENIPANSLLELHCVAQSSDALIKLAFLLFSKCNSEDEQEVLTQQLETISDDLAFQWYWLLPKLQRIGMKLQDFIGDLEAERFKDIYINWAMKQEEKMIEYLSVLGSDSYFGKAFECYSNLLIAFDKWIKNLCYHSLIRSYIRKPTETTTFAAHSIVNNPTDLKKIEFLFDPYVKDRQDLNNGAATLFFEKFDEPTLTQNERWFFRRIKAVAAHIQGKIDLFEEDDAVRRSIIFCNKSCVNLFAIALNNKLI